MASSSKSPQERSIASPILYDAFISHRGPDVKDTLAKQLYELLQARQCRAFLDREEIEGGDSITFAIRNGICSSIVQIAIFSKGYANSSWCLDELVLMLEQTDALFIPVFYDVEPWELRYIENENSQYSVAFSDYRSKGGNFDKLDEWKSALLSAAGIAGYEHRQHQDNLCENIVSRVLQEMEKRRPLPVAKYPVGLAELVEDFENSCSKTETDKVTMLGIFGLGGSGKTTLAKELLNRKRSGYSASCFLSDVRESHANRDLHSLQSQLLEDLFKEKQVFRNVDEGLRQLKHRLGRARDYHFLVVLDDIDHQDQLDALLPEGMLSPGSLVIVTTRNQSVLTGADITIRYKMKEMDRDHAKELFCRHAFHERDPLFEYENLVESFVEFCGGLPLSLAVLGAHVYRRDKHYWELQLEKVKKIQPEDIMKRLKISFDGLDREEKQIFIDIACCFNKIFQKNMKKKAISIWKASGWSAEHAVQTLQDKSLIEVKEDFNSDGFIMHDHLRDLGRQMADELGPPRLWRPDVLRSMEAKGFEKILAETKGRCFHQFVDSSLETITYFVSSSNDSAETQLLYLGIRNFNGNIKDIPSWIPLRNLGCLTVYNMKKLWSTFQQQLQTNTQASFELRKLEIASCRSSQNLPDLIGMFRRLEELEIENSLKVKDITSFLQLLKQLSNLRSLKVQHERFSGNLNLEASTSSLMNSLETIEFRDLDNISKLVISGEICPRLRSLEVQAMSKLNEIHLKQQLKRLNILSVRACRKLETISGLSSLTGLQSLMVEGCPKLETISGLSSLTGLQVFEARNCEGLKSLPTLAHLRRLERITIVECDQLQSIEGLEELQGLKSLAIQMSSFKGYALVRNCVHGLKKLPLESAAFTRMAWHKESSILDVNLLSDVIGAQSVAKMERRRYNMWKMGSSSTAITIYALLVKNAYMELKGSYYQNSPEVSGSYMMITVLLTPHNEGSLAGKIQKGFVASVNEGEEGKALTLLQTIVDRLFGESMESHNDESMLAGESMLADDARPEESLIPDEDGDRIKSAAYDVVKGKRKQMD